MIGYEKPKPLPVPLPLFRLMKRGIKVSYPLLRLLARAHRNRLSPDVEIVAVVGSFGKTTTTRLIRAIAGLETGMKSARNAGSFVALKMLSVTAEQPLEVLEVGINGPGQMEQHASMVDPTIAVVTTVGSEHNRSLKSLEETRHEKAYMVRALPESGSAVLNADHEDVAWMAGETRASVWTFGTRDGSDTRILSWNLDWPEGMKVRVDVRGQERTFFTRLLGRPGAYSVAAAVTVGRLLGVPMETIAERIRGFSPTRGRLQLARLDRGPYLLRDDHKNHRETLFEALDLLAEIEVEDKLVVLGEENEPDISLHQLYRQVGRRLARAGARAVFLGTSGRWRDLRSGYASEGGDRESILRAESLGEAIRLTREQMSQDQVILLKGRGESKLGRVGLVLAGDRLNCEIDYCALKIECAACPRWMVEGDQTRGKDQADRPSQVSV